MGGLLLAQEGGNTYLPAYDGNGNVMGMIKASTGSIDAAYEYDAFGNTLRESGSYAASNPFRASVGQLLAGDDDAPGNLHEASRRVSARPRQPDPPLQRKLS